MSGSCILPMLRSTSIIIARSSPMLATIDWCSCRRSISRSCSRSAATKDLDLASTIVQQALRSMMIDIESSSVIPSIIECKYCRRSMARSCSSSAPKAINRAISTILMECASPTMAESSSPTCITIDCKHSLTKAITSHRSIVAPSIHGQLRSTSIEVSSPSRQAIECMIGANQWLPDTKFTWCPDRRRHAPSWMKQAVSTMTMIRSLIDECSAMSMIPNELLFEIFSFL